ncbi:MAG: hypothetical protein JWL67_1756, partial [Solirubrobacterales bacterium]|nr:hypothetical protein [Solirubrobacterales bacterium]
RAARHAAVASAAARARATGAAGQSLDGAAQAIGLLLGAVLAPASAAAPR